MRVDVRTPNCQMETHRVVLSTATTPLPRAAERCGPPSYVIDPEYQVIHWTPEIRQRFKVPR